MYMIYLVILIIIALVPTIDVLIEKKKTKDNIITEKMRCKRYFQSIAFLWGSVLVVLLMCFIGEISLEEIGLKKVSFDHGFYITIIVLVLFGLMAVYLLYQLIMPLISKTYREEAKKQIADNDEKSLMLPRTSKEKLVFSLLSFSAGTCEEILYRGFMAFLLQAIFPGIPIFLIILIPSVLFGIGHFYQGIKGVMMTGIVGAVFMCLFIITDSLIPGMVLHFLGDFSSTFLLSEEKKIVIVD